MPFSAVKIDRNLTALAKRAGCHRVELEPRYYPNGRLNKLMVWFRFSPTSKAAIAYDWRQWRSSRSPIVCGREMAAAVTESARWYRKNPSAWGKLT